MRSGGGGKRSITDRHAPHCREPVADADRLRPGERNRKREIGESQGVGSRGKRRDARVAHLARRHRFIDDVHTACAAYSHVDQGTRGCRRGGADHAQGVRGRFARRLRLAGEREAASRRERTADHRRASGQDGVDGLRGLRKRQIDDADGMNRRIRNRETAFEHACVGRRRRRIERQRRRELLDLDAVADAKHLDAGGAGAVGRRRHADDADPIVAGGKIDAPGDRTRRARLDRQRLHDRIAAGDRRPDRHQRGRHLQITQDDVVRTGVGDREWPIDHRDRRGIADDRRLGEHSGLRLRRRHRPQCQRCHCEHA